MRTPDEIREVSIMRFKELARPKYDIGQEEHCGLLDETVTIEKIEEEILDLWFYSQSLRVRHEAEIKKLEAQVERWKETAKR